MLDRPANVRKQAVCLVPFVLLQAANDCFVGPPDLVQDSFAVVPIESQPLAVENEILSAILPSSHE
jgi:hypothetical protein